jgi:integrase
MLALRGNPSPPNKSRSSVAWLATLRFVPGPPPVAVQALEAARARSAGIGDAWVFPAVESPDRPLSRHTPTKWWRALEHKASVTHVPRCGWHSLRRKFATEMKHAPLRDLAYLGGWKSVATVVNVYQQPDDATMQSALATRRALSASS